MGSTQCINASMMKNLVLFSPRNRHRVACSANMRTLSMAGSPFSSAHGRVRVRESKIWIAKSNGDPLNQCFFPFRTGQKHKKVERKNEKSNRVFLSGLIARIMLQRLNIITNQKRKKKRKSQNSKVYILSSKTSSSREYFFFICKNKRI